MTIAMAAYVDPAVMSRQAQLPYIVCNYLLSANRMNQPKRLAILAEKHLLTAEDNEELKSRGMTVYDALIGEYEDCTEWFVSILFQSWNARLGTNIFQVPEAK